ncbi:MAG TPA: hypothetical protein VFE71_11265 [Bacteroidales bacterium]|nr:hypothetical protein [Bacteroidales bacterium]
MPSVYHATNDYKSIVPETVKQLIELLRYSEVQSFFNTFLENLLATSDLKILKRIAALESKLGTNGMESEDELSIPAQLNLLSDRIDNSTIINTTNLEPVQACVTKTESRAHLLVQKLKSLKTRKHLDSREIVQFLKYGIEERFRAKEGQNIRQIKKEVLEKAECLFKGEVELNKRKQGRREVRLILT